MRIDDHHAHHGNHQEGVHHCGRWQEDQRDLGEQGRQKKRRAGDGGDGDSPDGDDADDGHDRDRHEESAQRHEPATQSEIGGPPARVRMRLGQANFPVAAGEPDPPGPDHVGGTGPNEAGR
ncbi:hypothetical protein QU670_00715 [Actinomyces massiliensis]|uniref:hypothetical protein n=1 Tax=Actinomyces massiliensis TaxID=461393 RepID=UPI0005865F90|nr:hypothetical protein [Actinomyces massiliensis]WLD71814.1 hypothetical protein QU670_00715 [Actinomyces massiliensis]